MLNTQKWLDENFPNKEEVKEITGYKKNNAGKLTIANFPQLKGIDVYGNKLSQLLIRNCPQLTCLTCWWNDLTELTNEEIISNL